MHKIKKDICEIGRRLYNRELVASHDGNISVKVGNNRVLITSTMVSKGFMSEEDIVLIDYDGNIIEGDKRPSSEYLMHISIYKECNNISAIVHAHPVYASAFAINRRSVDMAYMPEAVMSLGVFPVADYAKPGTNMLAESILPYVKDHNGCLLANHGAVSWHNDLYKAYYLMEQLEFYCKTSVIAEKIGHPYSIL